MDFASFGNKPFNWPTPNKPFDYLQALPCIAHSDSLWTYNLSQDRDELLVKFTFFQSLQRDCFQGVH